jgi:hypothetical protein
MASNPQQVTGHWAAGLSCLLPAVECVAVGYEPQIQVFCRASHPAMSATGWRCYVLGAFAGRFRFLVVIAESGFVRKVRAGFVQFRDHLCR